MAWAGFIDYIEEIIGSKENFSRVVNSKSGWKRFKNVEKLRENVPEAQLIEAARDIDIISKQEMKSLLGTLSKRNECAHPSSYHPGLNETIGYIGDLLIRIEKIEKNTSAGRGL